MSNINRYKKEVRLVESVLAVVNTTQAESVQRIYQYAFEDCLYSDQDFFESINWYAKKAIRIAAERSLRASRKCEFEKIRFWNSVIIAIVPLLGDYPMFEVNSMSVHVADYA